MIRQYFVNYFERIKQTKKIARDKNVAVWQLPVFNSLIFTMYISWQLSIGVWILLDSWQSSQTYIPWYMENLWHASSFSITIIMAIITLSVLDKIILFFIYFHALINKLILKAISRLDMYLWKKTGKDSVFSTALWKMQGKFLRRTKRQRMLLSIAFAGIIVFYYGWLIVAR